ncbi:MAG: acyl-CoA reductase [Segetibacter sp.]|nr:acyl-CoA reductase [Segetibacter sp.]
MQNNGHDWQEAKEMAKRANQWFVPEFTDLAAKNIAEAFLQKEKLEQWAKHYNIPDENNAPKTVGLVMAGNIPMVGFHDLLCIFITGHKQVIKLSSKDDVLIKHLAGKMKEWSDEIDELIVLKDNIKGCDAYIATGSNNTSRYFEYYFGKYPNVIRKNRTSVAILDGTETAEELEGLADDINVYFGLGCRNVTKLYIPKEYNFEALIGALNKYIHFFDVSKYKNNYDYQLAVALMSNKFYMTNGSVLLLENAPLFTPVSQVNYQYYTKVEEVLKDVKASEDVQALVGHYGIPFGGAQQPALVDYADGVDTIHFLMYLGKEEKLAGSI